MPKTKNFNSYFEKEDMTRNETYSKSIVISIIRSVLEPMTHSNSQGIIFAHTKDLEGTQSLMKRLEYCQDVTLRTFSEFEFSKFDIEDIGFIVLTSKRYNCAFLFKEVNEGKYKIYLKMNSKLVSNVYETLKSLFLIDYDKEFYEFRPERRENEFLNGAIQNIVQYFEETIKENEYNTRIQENYKTVNETNTSFRNEIYQNVKQIAHEIKNQLSILDIYTRIFEKKTGDTETVEPIKKSIAVIKNQIEQFKNIDVVNLQHIDVKEIIQESISTYSNILKENNNKIIFIDELAGSSANVFADSEKFLIVINNIIKNANDVTKNDEIIIKISKKDEKIKISITNHGKMIPQNKQEKIFEQGYSTKRDGWGVGLSVCRKFIGSQFGTLELEKSDEKETTFTLSLPLAQ